MFFLYLVVAVLIFGVGVYFLGLSDWHDDEKFAGFWGAGFLALLWPAALAFLIIVGPFVGLFLLGDRKRQLKEKSTKNK
jgi:uncharacterized membrane protein